MAVAMAGQQPGHIEILQLLQRADLLLKIPPAVLLGAHQHLLLGVPPEVIAAEQHAAGFTQHRTKRTSGVPRRWNQLQSQGQSFQRHNH